MQIQRINMQLELADVLELFNGMVFHRMQNLDRFASRWTKKTKIDLMVNFIEHKHLQTELMNFLNLI